MEPEEKLETPLTKKRKSKDERNGPREEGTYTTIRTTKCSLNSSFAKEKEKKEQVDFLKKTILEIVLLVNQLQYLASLVIKHHLSSIFNEQNEAKISELRIDQSYINRVFANLRHIKPRKSKTKSPFPHEQGIKLSSEHVLKMVNPTLVEVNISATALGQILNYSSRTMITNYKVHVQERLEQSFSCWRDNQIRALLSKEQFENQKKYIKSHRDNLEELKGYPMDQHKQHQTTLDSLTIKINDEKKNRKKKKEEDEPVLPLDFEKCLAFMWQLRKESEDLEQLTKRPMKGIAVFPQNHAKIGFIRLDTRIIAALYKQNHPQCKLSIVKLAGVENQEKVWPEFFDMEHIRKLRPHWKFNWSIVTDGIAMGITYEKAYPIPEKRAKKIKTSLANLPVGLHYEKFVLEDYPQTPTLVIKDVPWIAIDPGIRTILTASSIGTGKIAFTLGQGQYKHESGITEFTRKSTERHQSKMKDFQTDLGTVAYMNSVSLSKMDEFFRIISKHWIKIWQFENIHKGRHLKFHQWSKQQKFFDRFLNKVESQVNIKRNGKKERGIILLGNGGASGQFMGLKSGGFKGPVVKLRKLLSKRFPVILVNEFRTSKLCLECGKELKHPNNGKMHGVSYCVETGHHRMLNRDVDGSRKIGYRFLAQLTGHPIGPWRHGTDPAIVEGGSDLFNFQKINFPGDLFGRTRVSPEEDIFSAGEMFI